MSTRRRNRPHCLHALLNREIRAQKRHPSRLFERNLATYFCPNETIFNVHVPYVTFRRFVPDGRVRWKMRCDVSVLPLERLKIYIAHLSLPAHDLYITMPACHSPLPLQAQLHSICSGCKYNY
jgi:hypothetical protein